MSEIRRVFRLAPDSVCEVKARRDTNALQVAMAERAFAFDAVAVAPGDWDIVDGAGGRTRARVSRVGAERWVTIGPNTYVVGVEAAARHAEGSSRSGVLTTPMPGRVVAVETSAGLQVAAGTTLVRIEAMKMEHAIRAPFDGEVIAVHVEVGAQVEGGALLVELASPQEDV